MRLARRPTALYAGWHADGWLLYIGVTSDPDRRFAAHDRKGWPVDEWSIERWYDRRGDALAAERRAIAEHRPPLNITGTGRSHRVELGVRSAHRDTVAAVVAAVLLGAVVALALAAL